MAPAIAAEEGGRQRRAGTRQHSLELTGEPPPDGLPGDTEALLPPPARARGYRAELGSILLLLVLYVLQGIPLGLAGSVPLILQSKSASYTDQAFFSFVFWPFSLKLLWAPLVDAVYLRGFGRRKSWLVPTQYVLGLFMIYMSTQVDALLGDGQGRGPDVAALTVTFFLFEFLAATQDIAVDGWALTMLSRENVGYASTCNSVGQTAGYFLGNVLFLALESASFCNKYLRFEPQPRGIVTLSGTALRPGCAGMEPGNALVWKGLQGFPALGHLPPSQPGLGHCRASRGIFPRHPVPLPPHPPREGFFPNNNSYIFLRMRPSSA